jgi:hypothetical protein
MTAVEWLVEQLFGDNEIIGCSDDLLAQAKKIEKQQHEQTFNESRLTHPMIGFKHKTFKQYYNITFKTTKNDTSKQKLHQQN